MFATQTTSFRTFFALMTVGVLLSACGGGASQTTPNPVQPLAAAGKSAPVVAGRLRQTSLTESQNGARATTLSHDSNCNGDEDNCHSFSLRIPLQIDDGGNLSIADGYPSCRQLAPWDAPWYQADGDFSLPVAQTTIPACAQIADSDASARAVPMQSRQTPIPTGTPSPTPSPTPTPTAPPTATPGPTAGTDLYIVRLDLGWDGVSVTQLSGQAQIVDGNYVFPASTGSQEFNDGHLYSFFVARIKNGEGDGHHHHHHH